MGTTTDIVLTEVPNGAPQGDVTINEAFWRLDFWANGLVQDITLSGPLASTTEGHAYIVVASASSAWAGHEDDIAHFFNSDWHFYTPNTGWKVVEVSALHTYYWNGSAWAIYSSAP